MHNQYERRAVKQSSFGMKVVAAATFVCLLSACSGMNTSAINSSSISSVANMLSVGKTAYKAATLSDEDVVKLSEKSCAASDLGKVAGPKSIEAERLATIVKAMPTSVNGTSLNYKLYITKDVNAWAMSNGCVRIYNGLLAVMDDDEVRAVIGHEIGHVALGHSKSALQTAYSASALRQAAAVSGNQTASLISSSQLGEMTEQLINAQFSQVQERAADDYSFDLLTSAKLKREALVTSFEKLSKFSDKSGLLRSHPSSTDRAQHIRDRIAAQQ